MIWIILGVVIGAGLVVWYSKNNKNTIAKARAEMEKAGNKVSDKINELKNK